MSNEARLRHNALSAVCDDHFSLMRCVSDLSRSVKNVSSSIAIGDNISMEVNLIAPIAMDEGLRFAIREGGRTVGAGVVAKVIE